MSLTPFALHPPFCGEALEERAASEDGEDSAAKTGFPQATELRRIKRIALRYLRVSPPELFMMLLNRAQYANVK
jgi:hypothetical protein